MKTKFPMRNLAVHSLSYLTIFTLYYFYTLKIIKPVLYYARNETAFFFTSNFFKDHLSYPGGLADYVGCFFAQFYIVNWMGALSITVSVFLLTLTTQTLLKTRSQYMSWFAHFIPGIILLAMHHQYNHEIALNSALLFVLLGSLFFLKLRSKNWALCLIQFIILAGVTYYLASGLFTIFIILAIIDEITDQKNFFLPIGYFIIGLLLPFISINYLFITTSFEAYSRFFTPEHAYKPFFVHFLLFSFFPLGLLYMNFSSFWGVLYTKLSKFIITPILFILLCALAVWLPRDRDAKDLLEIEYLSKSENWHELLSKFNPNIEGMVPVTYQQNRALFKTGKLLDKMFYYQQNNNVFGLVLAAKVGLSAPIHNSNFYWDLGNVNEAEHWAQEAISQNKTIPSALQRMTQVAIMKDKPKQAEKYLSLLDKTIFCKKWARQYRVYLNKKSLINSNPEFKSALAFSPKSDFFYHSTHEPAELVAALKDHSNNKMAFEYKLAYDLLACHVDNLGKELKNFKDLEYTTLPVHFEEAFLLYIESLNMKNQKTMPNLYDFKINPNTLKRFQHFRMIISQHQNNPAQKRKALAQHHINSYWYYYMYYNPTQKNS